MDVSHSSEFGASEDGPSPSTIPSELLRANTILLVAGEDEMLASVTESLAIASSFSRTR